MVEESAWKENEETKRLQVEEQAHLLEARIFKKQASRVEVKPGEEEKGPQRLLHATMDDEHQGARTHRQ